MNHPFNVTFDKGNGQFITWVRFAPNIIEARKQARKVLEREYNGKATLWKVTPYDKTFTVQELVKDKNGYEGWDTFCVRDELTNVHIATVGDVDRYYQDKYQEFAYLLAASPKLLRALELCYTRLFNYQAGMDDIRDTEATKELNRDALDTAWEALQAVKVPGGKDSWAVGWVASLVEACEEAKE